MEKELFLAINGSFSITVTYTTLTNEFVWALHDASLLLTNFWMMIVKNI